MSIKKCCVPNCNTTRADSIIMHLFPNPSKNMDRFNTWIHAIGGHIATLDPHTVFQLRRICHLHFEPCYHTCSKKLSPNAVPTLHISGFSVSTRQQPIQDVSNSVTNETENIRRSELVSDHNLSTSGQFISENIVQSFTSVPLPPTTSTLVQPSASSSSTKRGKSDHTYRKIDTDHTYAKQPSFGEPNSSILSLGIQSDEASTSEMTENICEGQSLKLSETSDISDMENTTHPDHSYSRKHHIDHSYTLIEHTPVVVANTEVFGGARTYSKHRVKDAPQKPKPGISISEDTDVMDFESDENITTDVVTMESFPNAPDVAGPFTWQNPSEVIYSDNEDDVQYIDTNIMTDDVLLYNDDKSSTINTCEMTNQDLSTNEGNVSRQREKPLQCHQEYKCNHCSGPIEGFRYRCVQCTDYDLCAACEARGEHERHYVLRIPEPRPHAEIDNVLQRIRHELMVMNNSVLLEHTGMLDSMKEEIKHEFNDPLCENETRENYEDERMDHMSTTYESDDNNHSDNDQSDNRSDHSDSDQSDNDQSDVDQSYSEQTECDTVKKYTVEDNQDAPSEITGSNHINKSVLTSGLKNCKSPERTISTPPTKPIISNVGLTQQRRYTNHSSENSIVQEIVTSPPNSGIPMSQSNIITPDSQPVYMNTSNQHLLPEQRIAYKLPQVYLKCLTAEEINRFKV